MVSSCSSPTRLTRTPKLIVLMSALGQYSLWVKSLFERSGVPPNIESQSANKQYHHFDRRHKTAPLGENAPKYPAHNGDDGRPSVLPDPVHAFSPQLWARETYHLRLATSGRRGSRMSALGQKRTCTVHKAMSALCQKRTLLNSKDSSDQSETSQLPVSQSLVR